jgi:hypothetical protein
MKGLETDRPITEEPIGRDELAPTCQHRSYTCVPAGRYDAECVEAKIYADPQFHRWVCRLRFNLVSGGREVCGFLNLGTGSKPSAGRRSQYWRAWVIASGDLPRRRQVLSPRVFMNKLFEVSVETVKKAHDGVEHPAQAIYSTVRRIVRALP